MSRALVPVGSVLWASGHPAFAWRRGLQRLPYSEYGRGDRVCAHSRLADVLSQRVHNGLMQVLDYAVVRAVDMDADLGYGPGCTSVEAGDCYGTEPLVAGPRERP